MTKKQLDPCPINLGVSGRYWNFAAYQHISIMLPFFEMILGFSQLVLFFLSRLIFLIFAQVLELKVLAQTKSTRGTKISLSRKYTLSWKQTVLLKLTTKKTLGRLLGAKTNKLQALWDHIESLALI